MTLEASLTATVDGGDVQFTFAVENAGDEERSLTFSDGQRFDVTVTDGDEEVWRWAEGMMFTQALGTERLGPGESVTYEAAWSDVPGGEYEARAELVATDADCEAMTTVSV